MRLSSWNIIPYVHYPLSIFHYPLKKDCPQEDSTSYQYAHNDERSPYEIAVWGIERSGFFNGREKWAKGFENQRV